MSRGGGKEDRQGYKRKERRKKAYDKEFWKKTEVGRNFLIGKRWEFFDGGAGDPSGYRSDLYPSLRTEYGAY